MYAHTNEQERIFPIAGRRLTVTGLLMPRDPAPTDPALPVRLSDWLRPRSVH